MIGQLYGLEDSLGQASELPATASNGSKHCAAGKLSFHADYFDHVMGTASVRESLLRGEPWQTIVAGWRVGIASFVALRRPHLLYEPAEEAGEEGDGAANE